MVRRIIGILCAAGALGLAVPAAAELNKGFEAWNRGDYSAAVREWRDLAAAGNADAQYNMAQAYRQGKGVEQNDRQAEILLAKAAAQGHVKATDTYGLLLFQSGRREQAMPFVLSASERGAPWAQYLVGIGHFNGDLVEKDWVRAYALMTLANAAGYQHAAGALQQMDDFIPLAQRQEAQLEAQTLKRLAESRLAGQLVAEDLAVAAPTPATPVRPGRTADVAVAAPTATRLPQPIPQTSVPPSIAAANAAVEEAMRVTGTENPGSAGAGTAGAAPPVASPPPVRIAQTTTPASTPAVSAPPPPPPPAARPAATTAPTNGPWRVQLGAFSVHSNADRLWGTLSGNAALAGKQKLLVPAGRLVKLQAGGFASRGDAQSACNALQRSGQTCIVTR